MTEERKHAILFAATLLCARKLIESIQSDKPDLAVVAGGRTWAFCAYAKSAGKTDY
jgi:hypothetical protein